MSNETFCQIARRMIFFTMLSIGYAASVDAQLGEYSPHDFLADPNAASISFMFDGQSRAKLGHRLELGAFSIAGLMEIRNHPNFEQSVLPNHSWKGFIQICHYSPILNKDSDANKPRAWASLGFEHESAHATMGIASWHPMIYQRIFDGRWRPVNMNALLFGLSAAHHKDRLRWNTQLAGHYYFESRNQPELTAQDLGRSLGWQTGIQAIYTIQQARMVYVSSFFKMVTTSDDKAQGQVFIEDDSGFGKRILADYPTINYTQTLIVQSGLLIAQSSLTIDIHLRLTTGHPGGFSDSREEMTRIGIGMTLSPH